MMTQATLETFPDYPATGEPALQAVWRTLVTDRNWLDGENAENELAQSYEAYRKVCPSPWGGDPKIDLDSEAWKRQWPTQCMLERANQGYRFSLTACGLVGLFPNETRWNDLIVLIAGANTPFVIRPREDGSFTLVGEAYVHGVMRGELLRPVSASEESLFETGHGFGYRVKLRPWNRRWTEHARATLRPFFDPNRDAFARVRDIRLR